MWSGGVDDEKAEAVRSCPVDDHLAEAPAETLATRFRRNSQPPQLRHIVPAPPLSGKWVAVCKHVKAIECLHPDHTSYPRYSGLFRFSYPEGIEFLLDRAWPARYRRHPAWIALPLRVLRPPVHGFYFFGILWTIGIDARFERIDGCLVDGRTWSDFDQGFYLVSGSSRPKRTSSRRIANISDRFIARASAVALPIGVRPTILTSSQAK